MVLKKLLENKTFAIVGNSPKELGLRKGPHIDSHDIVFRFNNFDTGPDYSDDYGSKTDVWVCSFCKDINFIMLDRVKVLCPLPLNNEHHLKKYGNTNIEMYRKILPECIPVDYFNELIKDIPNPSTGLAFLYWVYKEIGEINPNDIFGFSFFDKGFKHHYFDEDDRCGHDGELEKKFAMKWIFK